MDSSPTAEMLKEAIQASPLSQREIAARAGFQSANIITMLKQGHTRVPLERIPGLAHALDLDAKTFLLLALKEYHPNIHGVLVDVLELKTSEADSVS